MMQPALQELQDNLEELARRRRESRLQHYEPYPKQRDFHEAGRGHRERLFLAGNQLGKTLAGSMEVAAHLTGRYPDDWDGRRFVGGVRCWAAGVTGESARDNPQRLLLGLPGQFGTGSIPKDTLADVRMGRGMADAVDTVFVKHRSGGISQLSFKSYERGREKWQGETLDLVWCDEEPPIEIYTEALARISARKGLVFVTATPLLGATEVVSRFINEESPDRHVVRMEIDEAEHIPADERARIIAGYPAHEREARTKGIPLLGSGRVFPIAEERIVVEAFKIPKHWARIAGMDFGWSCPSAAAWLAWDRDSDTIYVTDAYRAREAVPAVHASAIKARGAWIPVAWPHDGLQHDKGSGHQLAEIYKREGVKTLSGHAQFSDGSTGVEAGVMEMLGRMETARFKVFAHLRDWLDEFRVYHRKDGLIVKKGDDLMSATRYAVMMLRHARTLPDPKRDRPRHYPPTTIRFA